MLISQRFSIKGNAPKVEVSFFVSTHLLPNIKEPIQICLGNDTAKDGKIKIAWLNLSISEAEMLSRSLAHGVQNYKEVNL